MSAEKAITYFEDAIKAIDTLMIDCEPLLKQELTEQKGHFEAALEALKARRWIPVEERLPECDESEMPEHFDDRGVPVLVVEQGCVLPAHWWVREKVFRHHGTMCEPTHWMPRPRPPVNDYGTK